MATYRSELITGCEYYLEELSREINSLIKEKENISKLLIEIRSASKDDDIIELENNIRKERKAMRSLVQSDRRLNSVRNLNDPNLKHRRYVPNKEALSKLRESYFKTAKRHLFKKDGALTIDQPIHTTYFDLHRPIQDLEDFKIDEPSVD